MQATPDELRAWLRGETSPEEAARIEALLAADPSLRDLLPQLSIDSDPLVQAVRQAIPAAQYAHEPDLARVLKEIAARGPTAPTAGPGDPSTVTSQADDSYHTVASTAEEMAPSLTMRQSVRDYKLLEKLGEGGMGAVYKAVHTKLDRIVAIKLIPPEHAGNAQSVARFEREMRAIGKLHHPNIVVAHDAGEVDGVPYLVMEHVDGLDVATLARTHGQLPVPAACEIVRQAALGLQHVHQHGLVHRDIKPSNLILTRGRPAADADTPALPPTVKLLDLGLALLGAAPGSAGELTSPGNVMGTLPYMAPEQAHDPHAVDIRADLYALGCTLYRLLAGVPPFPTAQYPTPAAQLVAHATAPPPPLATHRPDVPPALATLITRLLAKPPADRPATPQEVARALEPFCQNPRLANLFGEAPAPSETLAANGSTLTDKPTPASQPAAPQPAAPTPPRRRPLALPLAGMAALVLLAGIIIVIRGKDGREKQRIHLDPEDTAHILPTPDEVKPPVPEPAGAPARDVEREVAEWVVNNGGSVTVAGHDVDGDVTALDAIPNGPFCVTGVAFHNKANLHRQDWNRLGDLRFLEHVRADFCAMNDEVVTHLLEVCPMLVTLSVKDSPELTDAVAVAARRHGKLTHLDLSNSKVTSQGIAQLTDLPLQILSIGGCTGVGDDAIGAISRMQRLTVLYINNTSITDRGLRNFPALTMLLQLYAQGLPWSTSSLQRLNQCPVLELASVLNKDATLDNLRAISTLPSLPAIYVVDLDSVTKANISRLQDEFPEIVLLHPDGPGLPVQNEVAAWAHRSTGDSVSILSHLGPGSFSELSPRPFAVTGVGFTKSPGDPEELARLTKVRLASFFLSGDWVTRDHVLTSLRTMAPARWLTISRATFDEEMWGEVSKWTRLTNLLVQDTPLPSIEGMPQINNLKRLRTLGLRSSGLNDRTLATFRELTDLEDLGIEVNEVTGASIGTLRPLVKLRRINAGGTKVDDSGIDGFQKLTGLRRLNLGGTPITDIGLSKLAACKNLRLLWVTGNSKITEDGVAALQKALPKLTIFWDGNRPPAVTPPAEPTADTLDPIDYAAERKAAEGLIASKMAQFEIRNDVTGLGSFGPSSKLSDLPKEPFFISKLTFLPIATDQVFKAFRGCKYLSVQFLHVQVSQITADGLSEMPHCPRLVSLAGTFDNDSLRFLQRCPNLQDLDNPAGGSSGPALEQLRYVPSLRSIRLPAGTTNEDLAIVTRNCPKLTTVSMAYPYCTSITSLDPLLSLKKLRSLRCQNEHLTDASVSVLQRIPTLEALEIEEPDLATLERASALASQLRELNLRVSGDRERMADGSGWKVFEKYHDLNTIGFADAIGIDRQGMRHLAAMPQLKTVKLWGTPWFREDRAVVINEFRQLRPDIALSVTRGDRNDGSVIDYPALASWPEADDGSVAAWDLPAGAPAPAVVPFGVEEAKKHQAAWAGFLKVEPEVENALKMKFRLIPPTEFVTQEGADHHLVRVTQPYYLGTTEVTWDQFRQFVEAKDYKTVAERHPPGQPPPFQGDPTQTWRTPGFATKPDLPVTHVTMADVRAFCAWLSEKDQVTYRPPAELEWELAARAGGEGPYGWCGDLETLKKHAAFSDTMPAGATRPPAVGSLPANPFGLHDVFGSVGEYCENSAVGPRAPSWSVGNWGQLGGHGIWGRGWKDASPAFSISVPSAGDYSLPHVGFRVLRELPGTEPLPKPLERPVLTKLRLPLSSRALVSMPSTITGLRSWSVELASHNGFALSAIAWCQREGVVATAYQGDGAVRLWSSEGRLTRVLLGHADQVHSLTFSADGSLLAALDSSATHVRTGTIRVWDVKSGKTLASLSSGAECAAFSRTGRRLASGDGEGEIRWIDLDSGHAETRTGVRAHCIAWSPDGRSLVTGNLQGEVAVWPTDAMSAPEILRGPASGPATIRTVSWSPDGRWIAAGSDSEVQIWDAKTKEFQRSIATKYQRIWTTEWSRDNRRILVAGDGELAWSIVDALEGSTLRTSDEVHSCRACWMTNESAIAGWTYGGSGPLLFDASTGKILARGAPAARTTHGNLDATSPDGGELFVKRFADGRRLVFQCDNGVLTREVAGSRDELPGATFSPDGKTLAIRPPQGAALLHILDSATGKIVHSLESAPAKSEKSGVNDVTWSPDGLSVAASCQDGKVRIWESRSGKLQQQFVEHEAAVWNVAWSPDGLSVASASSDQTIRIWDPKTGVTIRTIRDFPQETKFSAVFPMDRLVWTPDSSELWISLDNQTAVRLNVATGRNGTVVRHSRGGGRAR